MAPSIEDLAIDVELARRAYRDTLRMACDSQDGDDDRTCLYLRKHQEPTYPGGVGTQPVWPEIDFCPRCILASERKFELAKYQARFGRRMRDRLALRLIDDGPGPLVLAEGATKRKSWIAAAGRGKGQLWIKMASQPNAPWGWAALDLWSDGQAWHWRSLKGEANAAALVLKTEPKRVLLASGFAWQIVRPNAELKGGSDG
jgi:hypothetical protein